MTEAILKARSANQQTVAVQRLERMKNAEASPAWRKFHSMADAVADRHPIHPMALMQTIGRLLPPEAVVIDETVSSGVGRAALPEKR